MFRDREDAASQLAERLRERPLHDPLVLGIPRGGMALGAVLARELDADLDIVLARKLRAPGQPELAIGAVSESGEVYLGPQMQEIVEPMTAYLERERLHQCAEIARRKSLFRTIRPQAPVVSRSVIVTDDGIATGSTMMAALQSIRPQGPRELILAVPVIARDQLANLSQLCDDIVYLLAPKSFLAIGQFYRDFHQLEDDDVCDVLRSFSPQRRLYETHGNSSV
jgi:predicted phosphoribosyltransferase